MGKETIAVKAGEYLIREAEASDAMYFLQKGSMAVMKRTGAREGQIGTIYAGELVGEMSFLDQLPRSASVKAITNCTVIEIPHEKFNTFLNRLPKWYRSLINTLLDRLRKANSRLKI